MGGNGDGGIIEMLPDILPLIFPFLGDREGIEYLRGEVERMPMADLVRVLCGPDAGDHYDDGCAATWGDEHATVERFRREALVTLDVAAAAGSATMRLREGFVDAPTTNAVVRDGVAVITVDLPGTPAVLAPHLTSRGLTP